ncbi:hypothetical protein H8E77_39390 [bacterium]|nr:hypothetical protein [bacterium]
MNNPPAIFPPGETHDVTLTLTPSIAEDISGKLTIYSDDPNSPTAEIPINGYPLPWEIVS